jgi:hypothetical protein
MIFPIKGAHAKRDVLAQKAQPENIRHADAERIRTVALRSR